MIAFDLMGTAGSVLMMFMILPPQRPMHHMRRLCPRTLAQQTGPIKCPQHGKVYVISKASLQPKNAMRSGI